MFLKALDRRICFMLTTLIIITSLFFALPVEASTSITCYPISGSIPVFSDCSRTGGQLSKKKGTIYYSDTVTILTQRGPSVYVRYPISGGKTKEGWIKTSGVLTTTTPSYRSEMWGAYVDKYKGVKKSTANISTYRHPNANNRCGSIYANDVVWIYSQINGYTQVRYPTSNGQKIAWIRNSELWKLR